MNPRVSFQKILVSSTSFLMILLSSGAVIRLIKDGGAREEGLINAVDYSGPLDRLPILWGAIALLLAFYYLAQRKFRIRLPSTLMAVIALGLVSSVWATNPKAALGAALLLLATALLTFTQVQLAGTNATFRFLLNSSLLIHIASLIFIFAIPTYGIGVGSHQGKWQGVFSHKNILGSFCVLTLCIISWPTTDISSRIKRLIVLSLSIILLIGSKSSTAALSSILVALLNIAIRRKQLKLFFFNHKIKILSASFALTIALIYLTTSSNLGSAADDYSSMVSRISVWAYTVAQILQAPFLGYGLDQMSIINADPNSDFLSVVGFLVGSAHNGFLETAYSIGLFGLALFIFLLFKLMKNQRPDNNFLVTLPFVLAFSLENALESTMLSFNIYFVVLCYLLNINTSFQKQR